MNPISGHLRQPERYAAIKQIFGGCYENTCMEPTESLEEFNTCWVDAIDTIPCSTNTVVRTPRAGGLAGLRAVGFAPSNQREYSSCDCNAHHVADHEQDHEQWDGCWQVSSGVFAPMSQTLWSDLSVTPSQQSSSWFDNAHSIESDTIKGSSRTPPLGTLDHEELRKRLGQVREWRRELGEEPLSPPVGQKAKLLKVTLWPSLQKKGMELVVSFTSRPLGMQFNVGMMPCVVKSIVIGSAAGVLGVKKGMVIKAIDGENVTDMVYDEFYAKICRKCNALPYISPDV